MPGLPASCIEFSYSTKFNAHFFQPVDRISGLPEIIPDKTGITVPMDIIHKLFEDFFLCQFAHHCLLNAAFHTKRSAAHVGSTAAHCSFFETNNFQIIFSGCYAGCKTGRTESDNSNIRCDFCHSIPPKYAICFQSLQNADSENIKIKVLISYLKISTKHF